MNYRSGFQRVYAVLSVAWFGFVLWSTPADRLRFWERSLDYDALAQKFGAVDATDIQAHLADGTILHFPLGTPDDVIDRTVKARVESKGKALEFDPSQVTPVDDTTAKRHGSARFDEITEVEHPESRLSKTAALFGLLLLPPIIGYFVLFHLLRWVFRGFRPAKQI